MILTTPFQPFAQGSAHRRRGGWSMVGTIFVIGALAIITVGFGHGHSGHDASDETHCAVCHVQLTKYLTVPTAEVEPMAMMHGPTTSFEPQWLGSMYALSQPPLRGPPNMSEVIYSGLRPTRWRGGVRSLSIGEPPR